MATNKQAIIRYRVIDKSLRQVDRTWSWQALAEACVKEITGITSKKIKSISERTIKGDIQAMRQDKLLGYYAPIEYDYKEKSYYYSNRDYSITDSPISKKEAETLDDMIALMRQFVGFKYLSGIENILNKLQLIVYESTSKSQAIIQLEQPTAIAGEEWLDVLYKAIKNKYAVNLAYQPFDGELTTNVISPYLLKEYKNRWFLFALKHENQELRTYGLGRIKGVTKSLSNYMQSDFNPDEYFKDIIGVSLDKSIPKQLVTFKVTGPDRYYIMTNPIHHSQLIVSEEDQNTTFSIEVHPNHELQKILSSYGSALSVI